MYLQHTARALTGVIPTIENALDVDDINVPDEVEVALEELFRGLRDKVYLASPFSELSLT